MSYEVRLTAPSERDLKRLPPETQARVATHIRALATDPRPPSVLAVRGLRAGNYRLRIGDLRLGYEVDDGARTVMVWQIGRPQAFLRACPAPPVSSPLAPLG